MLTALLTLQMVGQGRQRDDRRRWLFPTRVRNHDKRLGHRLPKSLWVYWISTDITLNCCLLSLSLVSFFLLLLLLVDTNPRQTRGRLFNGIGRNLDVKEQSTLPNSWLASRGWLLLETRFQQGWFGVGSLGLWAGVRLLASVPLNSSLPAPCPLPAYWLMGCFFLFFF